MNNRENGRNAGMRRDTNTIARCGNGRDGYATEAYGSDSNSQLDG